MPKVKAVSVFNLWRRFWAADAFSRFTLFFLVWIVVEDFIRKQTGMFIVYGAKYCFAGLLYYISLTRSLALGKIAVPRLAFLVPKLMFLGLAIVQSFNPYLPNMLVPIFGLLNAFFFVPMVFVGYYFAKRSSSIHDLFSAFCIMLLLVSSVGLYQAFVDPDFLNPAADDNFKYSIERTAGLWRVTSIFVDTGRYAFYVGFMFVFLLGYRMFCTRYNFALEVLIFIVFMAAITNGSRSPAFMALLALGIFVYLKRKDRKAPVMLVGALTVLAIVIVNVGYMMADSRQLSFLASHVLNVDDVLDRLGITSQTTGSILNEFDIFWGHGTGIASLGLNYIGFESPISAEGGYITLGVVYGIFVYPLWGLFVYSILLELWKISRRLRRLRDPAQYIPISVFIAFAIQYLFLFNLGMQNYENYIVQFHLWFMLGFSISFSRERLKEWRASITRMSALA